MQWARLTLYLECSRKKLTEKIQARDLFNKFPFQVHSKYSITKNMETIPLRALY